MRGQADAHCPYFLHNQLQPWTSKLYDRPKGQNGEGQDTKIGDDSQPEAVKTSDEEPKHDLRYKEAVVEGVFWPRGAPHRRGTRC